MNFTLLTITDFHQAAERALAYATQLAGALEARQVLLHVRRDSLLDPETFTGSLVTHSEEAVVVALHSLTRGLPGAVPIEIGHGRVVDAVAETVSRHQPALVVLGHPNTEGTPDELVSTTALDLLRAVPQPLLVVPYTVTAAYPPKRILLAVDEEEFSLGPHTTSMRHLLNSLHAEVTVLHVTPEENAEKAEADLQEIVRRLDLTSDLPQPLRTLSLRNPDAAEAILSAAQPADFDMVIVIARQRSYLSNLFHRSVTAQVLLHSAVPVLVLPASEQP